MRARHIISLKAVRHSNDNFWSFVILPNTPVVSRPSSFPRFLATHRRDLDSSLLAEGDRGRRTIGPTDAPGLGGRPRHAVARTRKGGAQEGEEDPAAGAPGARK
jgi:hypothetical protein